MILWRLDNVEARPGPLVEDSYLSSYRMDWFSRLLTNQEVIELSQTLLIVQLVKRATDSYTKGTELITG